jgi:hypothetical protein
MPKGGRKGGRGRQDSCLFPFHNILQSALTGGVNAFIVSPNNSLSPRALTEADCWTHFRVRRLRFRLHPQGAGNTLQAVGYIGGIQTTAPATVAQVGELLPSVPLGGDANCPTSWVNVSRGDLSGPLPWYKTIPGAADAEESAPGALCVAGTGTDTFCLEMSGVFEFKTAVATANTPFAVELRERLRTEMIRLVRTAERERMLKVLSTSTQLTSVPNISP